MLLTLTEKKAYIDSDFKKSALVNMPKLPADLDGQREWWRSAMRAASAFNNKYADKGEASHQYAIELTTDWMETLERIFRKGQL